MAGGKERERDIGEGEGVKGGRARGRRGSLDYAFSTSFCLPAAILNIHLHKKDAKKAPMLQKWIAFCYEMHVSHGYLRTFQVVFKTPHEFTCDLCCPLDYCLPPPSLLSSLSLPLSPLPFPLSLPPPLPPSPLSHLSFPPPSVSYLPRQEDADGV